MWPSRLTSWATNWAYLARLWGVSGMAMSTRTSYPFPMILDLRGERMFSRSWMLHAATSMKSQGTSSTFTLAPADWGFLPMIGKVFSCMAVRMNLWSEPRWDISSTNRTPSWASWMEPATTLSYAGVPSLSWPP